MLRNLMFSTMVAGVALAVGGVAPVSAQEGVPMFGSGPDRLCNVVVDSAGEAVLQTDSADAVRQVGTYDCPEQVMAAVVEPAAAPPLPDDGEVLFALNSYDLDEDAMSRINAMIFDIKDRELEGIDVVGHTDQTCPPGSAAFCQEFNQKLSEQRAQAVGQELVKQGVPVGLITTTGVGMTQLADASPPRKNWEPNRRAVIGFN